MLLDEVTHRAHNSSVCSLRFVLHTICLWPRISLFLVVRRVASEMCFVAAVEGVAVEAGAVGVGVGVGVEVPAMRFHANWCANS